MNIKDSSLREIAQLIADGDYEDAIEALERFDARLSGLERAVYRDSALDRHDIIK